MRNLNINTQIDTLNGDTVFNANDIHRELNIYTNIENWLLTFLSQEELDCMVLRDDDGYWLAQEEIVNAIVNAISDNTSAFATAVLGFVQHKTNSKFSARHRQGPLKVFIDVPTNLELAISARDLYTALGMNPEVDFTSHLIWDLEGSEFKHNDLAPNGESDLWLNIDTARMVIMNSGSPYFSDVLDEIDISLDDVLPF